MRFAVRISEASHRRLRDLAEAEKTSVRSVLERAIEKYRRQRFLATANRQYAALRADSSAWTDEIAERRAWDRTLDP